MRFKIQQIWGSILHKFEVQYSTNLRFNTPKIWGSKFNKFEVQSFTNFRFKTSQICSVLDEEKKYMYPQYNKVPLPLKFNPPQIWGSIHLKFEVQYSTNLRFNTQIWGLIFHKFYVQSITILRHNPPQIWGSILYKF